MRIRIPLFTLKRMRIRPFTFMRIRIQLLVKVMRTCDKWSTDPRAGSIFLHYASIPVPEYRALHCFILCVSFWILTLTRIRVQLFTLTRIRIQLLKIMLIHADPQPCPVYRIGPIFSNLKHQRCHLPAAWPGTCRRWPWGRCPGSRSPCTPWWSWWGWPSSQHPANRRKHQFSSNFEVLIVQSFGSGSALSCWIRIQMYKLHLNLEKFSFMFAKTSFLTLFSWKDNKYF